MSGRDTGGCMYGFDPYVMVKYLKPFKFTPLEVSNDEDREKILFLGFSRTRNNYFRPGYSFLGGVCDTKVFQIPYFCVAYIL